jgi:hypothetical protein
MRYPLAELMMVNLLAHGRGVLLHACAVKEGDQGILFAGHSGDGKSTIAELWRSQSGSTVLSDDRVIVRKKDGQFWIYGTPWHGDVPAHDPVTVPLSQIFIIQHARQNQISPLKPVECASRLFVRSFPTFWYSQGVEFSIDFLGQLTQEVLCTELGFIPDESLIHFVKEHVNSSV